MTDGGLPAAVVKSIDSGAEAAVSQANTAALNAHDRGELDMRQRRSGANDSGLDTAQSISNQTESKKESVPMTASERDSLKDALATAAELGTESVLRQLKSEVQSIGNISPFPRRERPQHPSREEQLAALEALVKEKDSG